MTIKTDSSGRVLVVSGMWPRKSNPISGVFVVQKVSALARQGVPVTVIVPAPVFPGDDYVLDERDCALPARVEIIDAPVARVPGALAALPGCTGVNAGMNGRGIARILRNSRTSFTACIVHGLRYTGLGVPYWKEHIKGKVAIVLDGVDPFFGMSSYNVGQSRRSLRAAFDCADTIALVGSPLRQYASKLGAPPRKRQWSSTEPTCHPSQRHDDRSPLDGL